MEGRGHYLVEILTHGHREVEKMFGDLPVAEALTEAHNKTEELWELGWHTQDTNQRAPTLPDSAAPDQPH